MRKVDKNSNRAVVEHPNPAFVAGEATALYQVFN